MIPRTCCVVCGSGWDRLPELRCCCCSKSLRLRLYPKIRGGSVHWHVTLVIHSLDVKGLTTPMHALSTYRGLLQTLHRCPLGRQHVLNALPSSGMMHDVRASPQSQGVLNTREGADWRAQMRAESLEPPGKRIDRREIRGWTFECSIRYLRIKGRIEGIDTRLPAHKGVIKLLGT